MWGWLWLPMGLALSVKTYLFLGSVLSFLTEAQNTLPKFASSPGRIFLVAKTKIASGS
ncbi:hypothetical protein M9Y82_15230 [Leptospira weilii]|uniref:Uncharacterized protein n=1 Tax=Leptospira weilii str. 2006001855 TaxID=996804 RepID=M6G3T3_9LEPT|nr:hypothetical protein [Leptospira weilii]EMM73601.1 hypothetical protein LEP1GSC038_2539 [Leptospira weilii str. 2006001855]MCL8267957.1 hypothetical protein [Leptospira weilii]